MTIGLVSYFSENRNVPFNMSQIERAMKQSQGRADILCFGEAFVQGFDALCWNYESDKLIALDQKSQEITRLCNWTVQYNISLIVGYIERDEERLYSSCMVLSQGQVAHNYRRISRGWKEYSITDHHYCEGSDTSAFRLCGRDMSIALCGDLWDYPEAFKTKNLLIWPVYVNYSLEEWRSGGLAEYAEQAGIAADDVLMINPIDHAPVNHGGSFHFHCGQVAESIPFDQEQILYVKL